MTNLGLIAFGVFLLVMMILNISMIVSLIRSGDERRQLIVLKASNFTLIATVGRLILDIIVSLIQSTSMTTNPFSQLSATAIIYFISLLFYKKKHSI